MFFSIFFPNIKGKNILALACGGGQQAPVFAAHGANVTVTDFSDNQLASETYVAEREKYDINIVKADMSKDFPFLNDKIFFPFKFGNHSFGTVFIPARLISNSPAFARIKSS